MTNKPLMMVVYKRQEAGDSSKPDHWFTDILSGHGPTHQFHEGEIKEGRENIKSFPVWHLPIHYNYKSFHTIPLMRITDTCFRGLYCSHGNSLSKWQLHELSANRDIPTHTCTRVYTHMRKTAGQNHYILFGVEIQKCFQILNVGMMPRPLNL